MVAAASLLASCKKLITTTIFILLLLFLAPGPHAQEAQPGEADSGGTAPPAATPEGEASAPPDDGGASEPGEDLDAFFEEAFGIAPEPVEQPVRILLDGEEYGILTALVTPAGTFTAIEAEGLIEALGELLNEEGIAAVREAADEEGLLSAEALAELDISVEYDRTAFVANLAVPGRYRGVQRLSVYGGRGGAPSIPSSVPVIEPALVSGGSALRGAVGRSTVAGAEEPNWDGSISMTPFFSAYDWLLTGSVEYSAEDEPTVDADNVYLRRLWPDERLELTIGDVSPGRAPFQNTEPMQGVKFTKGVDARPIYGDPLAELTIDDSQDIEVYVNDNRVYRRTLGPGRYEITDIPLSPGMSEVEVRFPDSDREPVLLSLPYGSELLPEGEQSYSYALGVAPLLWDEARSPGDFETDLLRLNGYHRYGVTREIAAGAGIQGSPEAGLLSLEGDTATPFGNIGLESAFSLSRRASPGWGVGVTYGLFFPASAARRSLRFSSRWIDENLATPRNPEGSEEKPLQFTLAYGQRLPLGYSATTRGNLRIDPFAGEADYGVGVSLNSPRIQQMRLSAQLRYEGAVADNSDGTFSGSIYFTFTPDGFPTVTARQDLAAPESSITLQQSGVLESGSSYNASLGTTQNFGENLPLERVSLNGGLQGRRGGVSGRSYAAVEPDGGFRGSGFGLSGETGLYFAGGSFGWARNSGVQSFALVSVPEGQGLSEVAVGRGSSPESATPGFLGTVVLKSPRPYEPILVNLTPASLPLGYELTPSRAAVETGQGTGAVITPQLEGTVFVRGVLLDPESGEPVTLATGRVYPEGDPERSNLFFTNREGGFEAQGLRAGDYAIKLTGGGRATVTIPSGTAGLYRLGEIELEAE